MRNLGCGLLLWLGAAATVAAEGFDRVVALFFKAPIPFSSTANPSTGRYAKFSEKISGCSALFFKS